MAHTQLKNTIKAIINGRFMKTVLLTLSKRLEKYISDISRELNILIFRCLFSIWTSLRKNLHVSRRWMSSKIIYLAPESWSKTAALTESGSLYCTTPLMRSLWVPNVGVYAWAQRFESVEIKTNKIKTTPPPARGAAGAAASSWTAWGPTVGLSGNNLAVHGAQQQHETHGPKRLAGTRPGDLQVQRHRCHWGGENIWQQQTKPSLRGDIITEFMCTNEVSSVGLRCEMEQIYCSA